VTARKAKPQPQPPERKRAALYARVSTAEQVEGTSLDTQKARCASEIAHRGWDLVEEFVDEGVSGAKANRPALDRLMAACQTGAIDAVVVTKLDRFGRSGRHLANAIGDLDDWGVTFVATEQGFDSGSSSGRMLRGMLGVFAEFEREQIVERTSSGLRAVAREGHWPGGPPPYGFQIVPAGSHRKLALEEAEAETIRKAVSLVLDDGHSTWEAAQLLNALGYKPRRSPSWTHHNLRRQLLDNRISGIWHYGRRQAGSIPVGIPALITPERHRDLLSRLALSSTGPRLPENESFYLLSRGRLFGPCGGSYHGVNRRERGIRQYRCTNARFEADPRCQCRRLMADDAEDLVWREVAALLAQPERLIAMAEDYMGLRSAEVGSEREQLEAIDAKVANLDRARTGQAAAALKAGLDPDLIRAAVAELDTELAALRQHRARLEAWRQESVAESDRVRRLWEMAETAHQRLAGMTPQERRAVLDLLDVRVTVLGWEDCTTCAGRGKVRGGPSGGTPCPTCRMTRHVPQLRIEGTVWDALLDRFCGREVSALGDEVPRPSTCSRP